MPFVAPGTHHPIARGPVARRVRPGEDVPNGFIEALRTTGAVRQFTDTPVADEVVARVLDLARFAPSGANAQAWHVVLVKDPAPSP